MQVASGHIATRLLLGSCILACSFSAMAAVSDYDHLIARVSHSCDAPFELQITLTNPGKSEVNLLRMSLPWHEEHRHLRIEGYETPRGRPAIPLKEFAAIADRYGAVPIPAGKSISGRLDLRRSFMHEDTTELGKAPTLFKIDFPKPRRYPGTPRLKDRVYNVVVNGPSFELYVPKQDWYGAPCPVFTVVTPAPTESLVTRPTPSTPASAPAR
ncbi:hypothetical protein GLA29479_4238 [Lysobacter antibioticus]|nr:hypothetical protein GLA29479_4238 [Lysobacter antibioticus]